MFIYNRGLFSLTIIVFTQLKLGVATLKRGDCSENFIKCESGECIKFSDVCDGTDNCLDRSDESHAVCRNLPCPAGSFRCAYGGCIDGSRKCDRIQDCSDNSDERLSHCPGFTWLTQTAAPCSRINFQCRSGECISLSYRCDGEVNCNDGSDESIEACYGLSCPVLSFQCAYGGCVRSSDMCDNKNSCADGSDENYLLCNRTREKFCAIPSIEGISFRCKENQDTANCVLKPGSLVKDLDIVHFRCEKGFGTNEILQTIYCYNATWNRESSLNSLCLRACPPLESSTTDFWCIYKGENASDCSASLPGTIATAICKEGHSHSASGKQSRQFSCLSNATWEQIDHSCERICGILDPTIANDQASLVIRNPWNVGIYVKSKGEYYQFCSGTLISSLKVLTAANCIFNPITDQLRQKKKLRIALGKYHNSYQHSHDHNFQIREVVEMIKPDNYQGSSNNYYNDVAIIKLASAVEINNNVMPICIDKSRLYKLSSHRHGSIVGWNLNTGVAGGNAAQSRCTIIHNEDRILKFGQLPYVSRDECSKYLTSFLNVDKFCAFSATGTDVTSVCNHDSGAGLTFKINDVHYIYGIVSTLVNSTDIRHTNNFINTFTDLTDDENLKFVTDNLYTDK